MPPGVYGSQEFYDLEVELLMRPGWLCIGRANDVPEPGNYRSVDIIGEQLVMCRDRQGIFRVLSRVCLHRWMEVVSGEGTAPAFQCPYHLWTYSLSGQLVGAPEMGGVEFDKKECALPEVRHELWNGWVFINLDGNAAPLGPQLAPLQAQLDAWGSTVDVLEGQVAVWTYDRWADDDPDGTCAWDWKVFIENFMECYHHMGPHAKSLQKMSPAHMSWFEDANGAYSFMHAGARPEAIAEQPFLGEGGNLIHIYPLTIMAIGTSGSTLHQVLPLGPGRCRVISISYGNPGSLEGPNGAELRERMRMGDAINEEDKRVNRGVQLAVSARSARAGRLSHLEQPLLEFYRYIGARLPAVTA